MSEGRKKLLIALGGFLVLVALGVLIYSVVGGKAKPSKAAPKISLIPTTPPPPPPPPKEEKKPEPPKEQKEVKEMPAPPKDAPPAPPSQELKMDGPAGDGPSAFSAGKITSDDISNVGKGTGGGGAVPATGMFSAYGGYASQLKSEVQRILQRNKDLRLQSYRVEVRMWIAKDGSLQRHEMVGSTGDPELDTLINQTLAATKAFSQPPDRMPQPIRLRINTANR
jgi:hypothetical protein